VTFGAKKIEKEIGELLSNEDRHTERSRDEELTLGPLLDHVIASDFLRASKHLSSRLHTRLEGASNECSVVSAGVNEAELGRRRGGENESEGAVLLLSSSTGKETQNTDPCASTLKSSEDRS
jgi:hypothetical protein